MMLKNFQKKIQNSVYVIAEIGINHCGDLAKAKFLIDQAKLCGADAVKFQTFRTEWLVRDRAPKMPYQVRKGEKESQFEMLKKVELSEASHRELLNYACKRSIDFISTPYDVWSADFLVKLGLPILKVASTDTTNLPFLRHLKKLPVFLIISTGVTSMAELRRSLAELGPKLKKDTALLHCVSNYPAPAQEVNLRCIRSMQEEFDCPVGFSDHTSDRNMGTYAVCAGARILEKHFTFDKQAPGPDHLASFLPNELKDYIRQVRYVEACLGNGEKVVAPSERKIKKHMQKSLVAKEKLLSGARLSSENLWTMRPASGISPLDLDRVIGKRLKKSKSKFEEICWEDISNG